MIKEINLIKEFSTKPYGRNHQDVTPEEYKDTGEAFRLNILAPALQDKNNEKVRVILTGYNRYARSFLDEAFGGLIRASGFTYDELCNRLEYEHATVKAIEGTISERIKKAAQDAGQL